MKLNWFSPRDALRAAGIAAVLCLAAALAPHAFAAEDRPDREEQEARQGQELAPSPPPGEEPRVSRRRASELVSAQYAGRVLSIRLEGRRWRVRLDNDGTVYNVFVDARSGRVSVSEN